MRLIQSRSAVAALQFGWRNLGVMARAYWWLFALGAVLDVFAAGARIPFLPSIIVSVTSVVPALFATVSFARDDISGERRVIGAMLTIAPSLTLGFAYAALARVIRLEPALAPVILLLALALSVLVLKILPLGFIYAFDDAPIAATWRKTWIAVTGLDWWNILGIFFISGLAVIPLALVARLGAGIPGFQVPLAILRIAAIIGLNAWAYLALGAFSSTYCFASELSAESADQPGAQTKRGARLSRTPRWFRQR